MNCGKMRIAAMIAIVLQMALTPGVWACAACFGASDDPMAKGMNAGIFALLGVVAVVLLGFLLFMVFLVRRASTHSDVMIRKAEEIRVQLLKERVPANC
jgi:uncharacterized membrane protein